MADETSFEGVMGRLSELEREVIEKYHTGQTNVLVEGALVSNMIGLAMSRLSDEEKRAVEKHYGEAPIKTMKEEMFEKLEPEIKALIKQCKHPEVQNIASSDVSCVGCKVFEYFTEHDPELEDLKTFYGDKVRPMFPCYNGSASPDMMTCEMVDITGSDLRKAKKIYKFVFG